MGSTSVFALRRSAHRAVRRIGLPEGFGAFAGECDRSGREWFSVVILFDQARAGDEFARLLAIRYQCGEAVAVCFVGVRSMSLCRVLTITIALMSVTVTAVPVAAEDDASSSAGATPEFFEGVRATGAGSSHTAVSSDFEAIFQNPAGVARHQRLYVIDGAFSYSPEAALMTAGITDAGYHNPSVSMGLAWTYFRGLGDQDHLSGHDGRLAIALPVAPEQISVGAGLRYLRITDETLPPAQDGDQLLINGLTFDAGVNIRPAEMVNLGLKAENLIDHCADENRCRGTTPTRVTGGVGFGDEFGFMLTAEATADLTSDSDPLFDFAVGGEFIVDHTVPVRAGFQRRSFLDQQLVSGGIGWRSEQMGIDVSYRHDLNRSSEFGSVSASFSLYPLP